MKKIILLLIICLGLSKVKAQTFYNYADTANYLIHQIEDKKSLYVGKPLSILLDSLKINPVRSYTAVVPKDNFGKKLYFEFNYERAFQKSHFIIVKFDTVPGYTQLFPLFFPTQGQEGTVQSIISTYNSFIIKDILVKDYTNDEPVNPNVHY